jgi:hypothetical protein
MAAGPVTTRVPASLLQLHANVEVLLDAPAAERLRELGLVGRSSRTGRVHELRRRGNGK